MIGCFTPVFCPNRLSLGAHTVDRFANMLNRQVERFNSRFWTPETEAVDTFTVDWVDENNWWCPPVELIPTSRIDPSLVIQASFHVNGF